jgi:hypothetical protein
MTFLYHKLCNKQNKLFSSSRSYLHKGQRLPNEFKKTYKPWLEELIDGMASQKLEEKKATTYI